MAAKHFYETFHPEHYDLFIDINRAQKTINGTSTITGEAIENTILINQKYMKIASVTSEGKEVPFTVNDEKEAIEIELGQTGKSCYFHICLLKLIITIILGGKYGC